MNMNMEGSRHERVTIVTTAYIIGFVTAFIAFGISQLESNVEFVYVPSTASTAAVVSAIPASEATLVQNEAGLVYVHNDEEVLLVAAVDGVGEDGQAVLIAQYELSPDGAFAYFCEQPTADIDACKPFVYDVANDIVIPLTQNGERIALSAASVVVEWNPSGISSIGSLPIDPLPVF